MKDKNSLFEASRQRLMYILSLPERTIRSLAALAGGTTTLLAETLFPVSFRGTRSEIGWSEENLATKGNLQNSLASPTCNFSITSIPTSVVTIKIVLRAMAWP